MRKILSRTTIYQTGKPLPMECRRAAEIEVLGPSYRQDSGPDAEIVIRILEETRSGNNDYNDDLGEVVVSRDDLLAALEHPSGFGVLLREMDRLARVLERHSVGRGQVIEWQRYRIAKLEAVVEAATVLHSFPIADDVVVVPQEEGVVEQSLTWGYLLADLRDALADLDKAER